MTTDTFTSIETGPARRWRPRLTGLPWATWRLHRTALTSTAATAGTIVVALLVHGLVVRSAYHKLGLDTCGDLHGALCQGGLDAFRNRYGGVADYLSVPLSLLPVLLGVFVGASLVAREWDLGTYRFAWTLGRSRARIVTAKLALTGSVLAVSTLTVGLVYAWWFQPFVPLLGRFDSGAYEGYAPVLVARTMACLTLGALLGALVRRTVPAMATTFLGGAALVLVPAVWLRPHFQAPLVTRGSAPSGLAVDQWVTDPSGHRLSSGQTDALDVQAGPDMINHHMSFSAWLSRRGYTSWFSYQPESRFWNFQVIEATGLLALAALFAVATVWWVRRPVS